MKIHLGLTLIGALIVASAPAALADYTVTLKNGRQITVRSYYEDGQMIKFYGLGGEIGLSKDQILSIRKSSEDDRRSLSLPSSAGTNSQSSGAAPSSPGTPQAESRSSTNPERASVDDASSEDQELQKRLQETSEQLELAKQRYFYATQGGSSSTNVSNEGLKAWAADLSSRIKDSQNAPASEYTPKMKELSDLRKQVDKLQKERNELLEEIKRKNS
jgi:hypothetical protein